MVGGEEYQSFGNPDVSWSGNYFLIPSVPLYLPIYLCNYLIFYLFEIILFFRQVLSLICFGLIGPLTKKFDERLVYLLLGLFFSLSTADKEN